jgi:hypothetical protein
VCVCEREREREKIKQCEEYTQFIHTYVYIHTYLYICINCVYIHMYVCTCAYTHSKFLAQVYRIHPC